MNKIFGSRHRDSPSDNRKAKIKNPKFALVGAMLLALCSPAMAQQQTKIPKIGWLGIRPDSLTTSVESFRREFYALGHVEGKSFTFEYRSADNKLDRLPNLV